MAGGILFPDLGAALSAGSRAGAASAQNQYLMKDRAARDEIAPLIPKALQGDRDALNQIGTRHPDTFTKLLPMLERMDAATRTRAKEATDWTTRAAMGVLSLPENERPAAYQAALADGRRLGYQIDMPPQYDRAVEGRLKHILNQARPIADYWKSQDEGVTLVPSGGGGGAAPPSAGPGGSVIDRSRAASASLESGGRYDAVGPVVNDKGNRAYGAHQVMDFNIGPWTQEVLGRAMTPQQFLADPKAQDAVYNAKMGQYIQKYGSPEAGARAWFAGEGGMNNPNAKDVLGTSVQGYGQRFAQAYGPGAMGPQPTMGTAPPSMVASGSNAAPMPQPPGGMAVPGTPAPMPQPPGLAQGDAAPRGDASGNPIQTSDGGSVQPDAMRMITPVLPPGTSLAKDRKTGKYIVQEGNFVVFDNATRNPVGLIPVPKPKEPGSGPFAGTGMDQQAMNILLRGDPASPEYALAYSHLSKARTTIDDQGRPVTIQPMDLSAVRRPSGSAPPPQAGGGAMPPVDTQSPGSAPSPAAPGGGATTVLPGGGTVTVGEPVAPKGPSGTEMAKLRAARSEVQKITDAAEKFREEWKKASVAEKARAMMGGTTPLNSAYNNFALLLKGESGYNLGVLNGPDLEIIRRAIPDPSTLRGNISTLDSDMNSAVDQVKTMLRGGIQAQEEQLGIAKPQGTAKGTYMGPDNKPISWPEIEATAKNRGITPDEVVRRLGLQPTGMQ